MIEGGYKNLYWIGMIESEQKELIIEDHFEWDGKKYPVGSRFDRLGQTDRTSLNIGCPLEYKGRYGNHVLFYPIFDRKQKIQYNLFEEAEHDFFIAPLDLGGTAGLLMRSSEAGFFDITPY